MVSFHGAAVKSNSSVLSMTSLSSSRKSSAVHPPMQRQFRRAIQPSFQTRFCFMRMTTLVNSWYSSLPISAHSPLVRESYSAADGFPTGRNWWKLPYNITLIPPNSCSQCPPCQDFSLDSTSDTNANMSFVIIEHSSTSRYSFPAIFCCLFSLVSLLPLSYQSSFFPGLMGIAPKE